jgi:hypothetical protein
MESCAQTFGKGGKNVDLAQDADLRSVTGLKTNADSKKVYSDFFKPKGLSF